jgi:hypothetical protein
MKEYSLQSSGILFILWNNILESRRSRLLHWHTMARCQFMNYGMKSKEHSSSKMRLALNIDSMNTNTII